MSGPAAALSAAAGLRVDVAGPVATLRVENPGGIGPPSVLGDALADQLRRLTGEVRVVVIRADRWTPVASGDGHSDPEGTRRSAADLVGESLPRTGTDPAGGAPAPGARADHRAWREAVERLSDRADLLSVAVVHGRVSDLGLALALACDFRVLAAGCRLRLDRPRSGGLPLVGVVGRLIETLGYPGVLDLCLTARELDADEAVRRGVAHRVAAPGALEHETAALVDALLAVPRDTAAEVKALLRGLRRADDVEFRQAEDAAWERQRAAGLGGFRGAAAG